MHRRDPNPDVIIISGDFLVHFFQYFFNSSVTNHSPATYAAFVNTTEEYLALKFLRLDLVYGRRMCLRAVSPPLPVAQGTGICRTPCWSRLTRDT
jgi:hypothetical protein